MKHVKTAFIYQISKGLLSANNSREPAVRQQIQRGTFFMPLNNKLSLSYHNTY